jgi:hypothetical protein
MHLVSYAEEHGLDLAPYHELVAELRRQARFVNPETMVADFVLGRVRVGMSVTEAVADARQEAIDTLDAAD